ncbi:MAG: MotA/TolQ/ExbB proton channel family protein [Victivallaceae bacterium]
MRLLFDNPIIQAYMTSDLFGKGIFISLICLSLVTWVVLQQKIMVQKKFCQQGKVIRSSLMRQRTTPLALDRLPPDNPFADLYLTVKLNVLELLNGNEINNFLSPDDISSIETLIASAIPKYRSLLDKNTFIPGTAISLAPFLGLLGTVWGILCSFSSLGKTMGNTSSVTGNSMVMEGLSTALGTTILGLAVAIPALVVYNYLRAQSTHLNLEIEQFAYLLLNAVECKYKRRRT